MSHTPTVIVSITDGIPEVLWADGEVNVIIAEYGVEEHAHLATPDPDGNPAAIYEVAATVDPERVRQYVAIVSEVGR